MSVGLRLKLETLQNSYYRDVVWTTDQMQLVLMSLEPGDEIPAEIHHSITQFIRIEEGSVTVTINGKSNVYQSGDAVIIGPGDKHYIFNSGDSSLKLYTLYSPPVHEQGLQEK